MATLKIDDHITDKLHITSLFKHSFLGVIFKEVNHKERQCCIS